MADAIPDFMRDAPEGDASVSAPALTALARRVVELRASEDAAEQSHKKAKADTRDAERALLDAMVDADLTSFKADGLGQFVSATKTYASVEDQDALFRWLAETNNQSLIRQTVHPSTLRSFVVDMMADGQAPPPGVKTYSELTLSVRKAR